MYCTVCGKLLPDDAAFCSACGAPQKQQGQLPYLQPYCQTAPPVEKNRYNGYGIAGFVLSILGLLGGLLYAILGLIFSCIGMKKRPRFNSCNALAKAGMIMSIIALAAYVIVLAVEWILFGAGILDEVTYIFLI